MTPEQRRWKIMELLSNSLQPCAGANLASVLSVSRQIIVQDISILRASGKDILATPRGYILNKGCPPSLQRKTFAVRHDREEMERELNIFVDAGGTVIDVIVEHPIYGELKGLLMLKSRRDVNDFVKCLKATGSRLLSDVTGGIHLHTIEADKEETFTFIEASLQEAGFLLSNKD